MKVPCGIPPRINTSKATYERAVIEESWTHHILCGQITVSSAIAAETDNSRTRLHDIDHIGGWPADGPRFFLENELKDVLVEIGI